VVVVAVLLRVRVLLPWRLPCGCSCGIHRQGAMFDLSSFFDSQ